MAFSGRFDLEQNLEIEVIEAAARGDIDSLAVLYNRYYSSMVAIAMSLLGDKHLAEDVAQETFAEACSSLPKLRRKEKFGAWLAAICRNSAKQMLRRKDRIVVTTAETAAGNDDDDTDARIDAVRQAVWKLRPIEREPVILRYYDNIPYERIASLLGISVQAVNGRLIRAKRKIARYMKRNGFTRGRL